MMKTWKEEIDFISSLVSNLIITMNRGRQGPHAP